MLLGYFAYPAVNVAFLTRINRKGPFNVKVETDVYQVTEIHYEILVRTFGRN